MTVFFTGNYVLDLYEHTIKTKQPLNYLKYSLIFRGNYKNYVLMHLHRYRYYFFVINDNYK